MQRIEGIFHFTVEHFYSFEYLNEHEELFSPSLNELISYWYLTLTDYNFELMRYLKETQIIVDKVTYQNKSIILDPYIVQKVSKSESLGQQLTKNEILTYLCPL